MYSQLGQTYLAKDSIAKIQLANHFIGNTNTARCFQPRQCETGCAIYTFIGSGSWENPGNWKLGLIPPETIDGCYEIRVNPIDNENAVMIVPRAVIQGGKVIVEAGKKLFIPGNLIINTQ